MQQFNCVWDNRADVELRNVAYFVGFITGLIFFANNTHTEHGRYST